MIKKISNLKTLFFIIFIGVLLCFIPNVKADNSIILDYNKSFSFTGANNSYFDTGYKMDWMSKGITIEVKFTIPQLGQKYKVISAYSNENPSQTIEQSFDLSVNESGQWNFRIYGATAWDYQWENYTETRYTLPANEEITFKITFSRTGIFGNDVSHDFTTTVNYASCSSTSCNENNTYSDWTFLTRNPDTTYQVSLNSLRLGNDYTTTTYGPINVSSLKITTNPYNQSTTITLPTLPDFGGWYTSSTGGTQVTTYTPTANQTVYAIWGPEAPETPTISGGASKVWGASDTTLTCNTSTTYSGNIDLYYSFGYSNTDGGTPSSWTSASTSKTLTINKYLFVGARYYSCRVYAKDNSISAPSATVTSLPANDTEMSLYYAKVTFNKNLNSATISGTNPVYMKYGTTNKYNDGIGSATASIPTISTSAGTFKGWYTEAAGGEKVINADGSIISNVSGWTDTNGKWILKSNSNLYAHYFLTVPEPPTISGGGNKIYNATDTTLTCTSNTYYDPDSTIYYSFGYSETQGVAPATNSWVSTGTNNTFVVPKNAYLGERWYSCKMYATNGSQTSQVAQNDVNSATKLTISNPKISLILYPYSSAGVTWHGDTTLYLKYGESNFYSDPEATVVVPVTTVEKTGFTFIGWKDNGGSHKKVIDSEGNVIPNVSDWTDENGNFIRTSDATFDAVFKPNSPATTISGSSLNTTYHQGGSTTLTCIATTDIAGAEIYYSFGYRTSTSEEITNWTTPSTSNTRTINSTSYVGEGLHSCRAYVKYEITDPRLGVTLLTATSDPAQSSEASEISIKIYNTSIYFSSVTGASIPNPSVLYTRYGSSDFYTGSLNSTVAGLPLTTLDGSVFKGWYTDWQDRNGGVEYGEKVIDSDGTIIPNVSGWTDSSGKFILSLGNTLYAHFNIGNDIYSVTLHSEGADTHGTTKFYYQQNTYQTIDGHYCFFYTDPELTECLPYNNQWSSNLITSPTKNGNLFGGYYNEPTGEGNQWIYLGQDSGSTIYVIEQQLFRKKPSDIDSSYTTDIPLYAKFTPIKYYVSYYVGYDWDVVYMPKDFYYHSYPDNEGCYYFDARTNECITGSVKDGGLPVKEGYNFEGFYSEENGGGTKYIDSNYNIVNNLHNYTPNTPTDGQSPMVYLTMYAYRTPKTYSVILKNSGASSAGTMKLYYSYNTSKQIDGQTCYFFSDPELTNCVTQITPPTKDNSIFAGYYSKENKSGTQYVNSSGNFLNSLYSKLPRTIDASYSDEVTLYAGYNPANVSVTLPDGTIEIYNYGDTYDLGVNDTPADTVVYGDVTFRHYCYTNNNCVKETRPILMMENIPNGWKVRYGNSTASRADNAVWTLTQDIVIEPNYTSSNPVSPTFPEPLQRENFEWEGWYDSMTGGNLVESTTTPGTLYGHWTSTDGTFTVTYPDGRTEQVAAGSDLDPFATDPIGGYDSYEATPYHVTYHMDGNTIGTYPVFENTMIAGYKYTVGDKEATVIKGNHITVEGPITFTNYYETRLEADIPEYVSSDTYRQRWRTSNSCVGSSTTNVVRTNAIDGDKLIVDEVDTWNEEDIDIYGFTEKRYTLKTNTGGASGKSICMDETLSISFANVATDPTFKLYNPPDSSDMFNDDYKINEWSDSTTGLPALEAYLKDQDNLDKYVAIHFEYTTKKDSVPITYELNGGVVEIPNPTTVDLTAGTAGRFTLNNPTKEHYTFIGWTGSGAASLNDNPRLSVRIIPAQVSDNIIAIANYELREYPIIYDLDGGTAENPETYNIESDSFVLNRPTKPGYAFKGWTGTDLTEPTKDVIITNGSSGSRTYTANWEEGYTVTYPDGHVETVLENEIINLGTNNTPKEDEDVSTVTFKYHNGDDDTTANVVKKFTPNGWLVNGVTKDDDEDITVTENIVIEYNYSETKASPEFPEPTKEHYLFSGWYTEENAGTELESYTGDEDITLHAHWLGEEIIVTLPDDTTETYNYGDTYTLGTNDVAKADENGAEITFKYQDGETSDTTEHVIKSFTPNGWLVNNVEQADDTVLTLTEHITIRYNYIETKTSPEFPEPTRDHYTFDGWFDEETGGNEVTTYTGDENINLYAHWTGEEITVTYPDDTTETYNYGDSFTFGENTTPKQNENGAEITFKYQDNETDDTTSNVIRSFTPNGWKVGSTEYSDNEVITLTEDITIEYNYTETKTSPEFPTPTRENYTFDGWYDSEEEGTLVTTYKGDEDITLYAYWTLDKPTGFDLDSESLNLVVGETHQIVPTFTPEGTTDTLVYSEYDNEKVSVSDEGLITALAPGETTIKVTLESNSEIYKEIEVTVVGNELTSEELTVKERTLDGNEYRIIVGEEPNTPLEDFLEKIGNDRGTLRVFNKDGEEIENITDEVYTATGMVVKLVINDNVLDEAIVIVRGDINEDGLVDAQDKARLKNHLLGKDGFIIDDYRAFACDLVEDPEAETIEAIVNAEDNARLANYLLGKPNSDLNPHE